MPSRLSPPDMKSTGKPGRSAVSRSARSVPLPSRNVRSVSRRSASPASRNASPGPAASNTQYPARLKSRARTLRTSCSSSTRRTVRVARAAVVMFGSPSQRCGESPQRGTRQRSAARQLVCRDAFVGVVGADDSRRFGVMRMQACPGVHEKICGKTSGNPERGVSPWRDHEVFDERTNPRNRGFGQPRGPRPPHLRGHQRGTPRPSPTGLGPAAEGQEAAQTKGRVAPAAKEARSSAPPRDRPGQASPGREGRGRDGTPSRPAVPPVRPLPRRPRGPRTRATIAACVGYRRGSPR